MEARKLSGVSIKEYLGIELDTKYEYHDGSIFSMAGGILNHGLVCGNIFGEIRASLREKKENAKF